MKPKRTPNGKPLYHAVEKCQDIPSFPLIPVFTFTSLASMQIHHVRFSSIPFMSIPFQTGIVWSLHVLLFDEDNVTGVLSPLLYDTSLAKTRNGIAPAQHLRA